MWRQFMTKEMSIRITGDNGQVEYPLIEPDDVNGAYDFKASVIPAIAGQNDVKRKQDMDLFQLLANMPFIDPEKLTTKMLHDWSWDMQSIKKEAEEEKMPIEPSQGEILSQPVGGGQVPDSVAKQVMAMLGSDPNAFEGQAGKKSLFSEMGAPVNLLETQGEIPPTPRGVAAAGQTTNPRGMNRGGKVNTNIPIKETASPESNLMNRVNNIQR
jgi:hypothetical protein